MLLAEALAESDIRVSNGKPKKSQDISLKRSILKGVFGSMGVRLMQAALGFIISILMANGLGPEGVGTYGSILAIIMILNIPVEAGVSRLVMRRTALYDADQDYGSIRGLVLWAVRITLGVSILTSTLVIAAGLIDHEIFEPETRHFLIIAAPAVPIVAFASLHAGYLRGLRAVVLSQIGEPVRNAILTISLLLLVLLPGRMTVEQALLAFTFASFAALALMIVLSYRCSPKEIDAAETNMKSRLWLVGSVPFLLIGGIGTLSGKVDVLLLGMMSGMEATGHFLVATQFAVLVLFGLTAVTMTAAPHFTRLHRQGDKKRLTILAMKASQSSVAFAAFVAIFLFVVGPTILTKVYGDEFLSSYPILMVLMSAYLVQASTGASGPLLSATGHEGKTLRAAIYALAAKVATCLILIPFVGALGAAIGILVSMICLNFLLWRHCRIELGVETFFLMPAMRKMTS